MMAAKPPNIKRAPDKAHGKSEYISFGVIASEHFSGFPPNGMMNANYHHFNIKSVSNENVTEIPVLNTMKPISQRSDNAGWFCPSEEPSMKATLKDSIRFQLS